MSSLSTMLVIIFHVITDNHKFAVSTLRTVSYMHTLDAMWNLLVGEEKRIHSLRRVTLFVHSVTSLLIIAYSSCVVNHNIILSDSS